MQAKRQTLQLDSSTQAPPFPAKYIGIVTEDKNGSLLPNFMLLIASLPGAVYKRKAFRGRDTILYNGVLYVDTHTLYYLNGTTPDVSGVPDGYIVAPVVVLGLIELQVGPIDAGHKGKMESYLLSLLEANPERHMAKGVVFNGAEFVAFSAVRTQHGDMRTFESLQRTMSSGDEGAHNAWAQLWNFVLNPGSNLGDAYGWRPPHLTFDEGNRTSPRLDPPPLQMGTFIASSGNVNVWNVTMRSRRQAVCKLFATDQRQASFEREVESLQCISGAPPGDGRGMWPTLIGSSQQQRFILTAPFAKPLGPLDSSRLRQLFAGVRYLHTVPKRVWRDLEDKNLGETEDGQVCGYDLGTSAPLEAGQGGGSSRGYAGTIVNASEDVLDAVRNGNAWDVPARTQQDLAALVKTAYAFIHTSRLPFIQKLANEVADDLAASMTKGANPAVAGARAVKAVDAVRSFWDKEFKAGTLAGKMWRKRVLLAHVDTHEIAVKVWGPEPSMVGDAPADPSSTAARATSAVAYEDVMRQLEEGLQPLVYP